MGRLIDADVLKGSMKKFAQEQLLSEYQCLIMVTDVLDDIDNQPTAYDVEKVVEQLKEQDGVCTGCKRKDECNECSIGERIEIVKGGGQG